MVNKSIIEEFNKELDTYTREGGALDYRYAQGFGMLQSILTNILRGIIHKQDIEPLLTTLTNDLKLKNTKGSTVE